MPTISSLLFNPKGLSFLVVVLLVVVMSIAVTSVFFTLKPALQTGQANVTIEKMEKIKEALIKYRSHHNGAAPVLPQGLDRLVSQGSEPDCSIDTNPASGTYKLMANWCGPYLVSTFQQDPNEFKTDGWGTFFQYDTVTLTSCGPNRTCGDGDDLTEIF